MTPSATSSHLKGYQGQSPWLVRVNGHLLDSLCEILEQHGSEIRAVNARHVKNMPGRTKTDVLDCQWIQKLHSFGLLNC
jgi:hypothetical protein